MIDKRSERLAALALALALGCGDGPVENAAREDDADAAGGIHAYHGVTAAGGGNITLLDDCDPADPTWAPTGGCTLARGHVTQAEFSAFAGSALSSAVVGHPAWRTEPSYVRVRPHQPVHVMNRGGRPHTLTPVAAFGGGRVPPLNAGLTMAPECALAPGAVDPFLVLPGESFMLRDLPAGVHRLQCCLHPWMRQVITVEAGAS